MKLTTLCYIEKDDKYLMLHRTKKKEDFNKDKWIGVGGKFEKDETPDECLLREVKEETGLTLTKYRLRSIITFLSDEYETEYMYLYTASGYIGELKECDEGELVWIDKKKIFDMQIWEGDKVFLNLIESEKNFFSLKLRYEKDKLVEHSVNLYGEN